jgi:hypothetical protein
VKPVERLYLRRSLYSFASPSSKPSPEICVDLHHSTVVADGVKTEKRKKKKKKNEKETEEE